MVLMDKKSKTQNSQQTNGSKNEDLIISNPDDHKQSQEEQQPEAAGFTLQRRLQAQVSFG